MLDWLYPQVVEKVSSRFNGEIKVTKSRGRFSVWVGGFEQSGPIYVEKIWKKALSSFWPQSRISEILILGLGCGTLVKLISEKWSQAKITGVEIDPVMVALGKKYFDMDEYKNLTIVNADALQYTNVLKQKFDLILVDTYISNQKRSPKIPKRLLAKGGIIITNHLRGIKNKLVVSGPFSRSSLAK